jgi:hypothetical protein
MMILTDDQHMIRDSARSLACGRLAPFASGWVLKGTKQFITSGKCVDRDRFRHNRS